MCDKKTLSFDIETTGLTWNAKILSLGASWRNGDGSIHSEAWPIGSHDLFHAAVPVPQVRAELLPLINQAELLIGHNITYDLGYLFKTGILLPSDVKGKLVDTLTLARMTGPHESVALDNVCAEFDIGTHAWRAKKGNRKNLSAIPVDNLLIYNKEDTHNNLLLGEALWDLGKTIYDPQVMLREGEFCRVMAEIRHRGIGLNADKLYDRIKDRTVKKAQRMNDLLWVNKIEGPNDRAGLMRFLDKYGVHSGRFTPKGAESFNEKAIKELIRFLISKFPAIKNEQGEHLEEEVYYEEEEFRPLHKLDQTTKLVVDVLDAVLACRGWEKEINTWLYPMAEIHAAEDGRVHPNYTVAGAVTYRLTCSEPPFQAMPKMDIWEPHYGVDWSQAEYRLAALYANDHEMAQKYAEGWDAHAITAQRIFNVEKPTKKQRFIGKGTNFASNYGAGPPKMAAQLGISIQDAIGFLSLYRKSLPKMYETSKRVRDRWKEIGYIKLWNGIRKYPRNNQERYDKSFIAWNALMQGGVAQLAKEAMLECDRKSIVMLGQIHDEIKFHKDTDIEEAVWIMENTLPQEISGWTRPAISMKADFDLKQ